MENAKTYKVKPEYMDAWFGNLSTDEIGDGIVTEAEVLRLSREWEVPVEELLEHLEEE